MSEGPVLDAAIVGGGPAGLMAADILSGAGMRVAVFEAKPSLGRKFLMAGKSGLNITKSEDKGIFLNQYRNLDPIFEKALSNFLPADAAAWCAGLGIETFIGTSGRVFPCAMKASPLLRALIRRLAAAGVQFHTRHRWNGFEGDALRFDTPGGPLAVKTGASLFALGGASWAKLGSDGAWQAVFEEIGVGIAPFRPSNCGFDCAWDRHFIERFAGQPVKGVQITAGGRRYTGDFIVTRTGVEGGAIYPLVSALRTEIEQGAVTVAVDLKPDVSLAKLEKALARPSGRASIANHWRKTIRLTGTKAGLLRVTAPGTDWQDAGAVAHLIKALPLELLRPRPLDEAISTAGGVRAEDIDDSFMLKVRPGTFVAGEMLDWDAPTGGYLLTACLATGKAAGEGALSWLRERDR